MNDIINQIIQIDSVAFENKLQNERVLINKKQEYENIITNYRNGKIALAKFNADQIKKSIEETILKQEDVEKEKIIKISKEIEEKYSQIEENLIQDMFNKLFVLEG